MFLWRPICLLMLSCALLLAGSDGGWARSEFQVGVGADNSFIDVASEGGGEYLVFDRDGQIIDRQSIVPVSYDRVSDEEIRDWGTIGEGARANGMMDLSESSLRPVWIAPSENLVETVEERGGFVASSGGGVGGRIEQGVLQNIGDGDATTAMVRAVDLSPTETGVNHGWIKNAIVNLGWELPINRIRFFPRPSFEDNFLPWFELGVAPGSAPIVDRPSIARRGQRWFYQISRGLTARNDPIIDIIESTTENLDVVVDRRFPTRPVKWVTLRPINPERTWEVAELQVFGEGYVQQTVYRTDILDFGRPVAWSKIRWEGVAPEGTRVEVRTRTGNTEQPFRYSRKQRTGQFAAVDRREYNDVFNAVTVADPFSSGSTRGFELVKKEVDTENWSFWSPAYDFAAGLRDASEPPSAWTDGATFLSKSPARYLQFEVLFFPTAETAPRVERIELLFGEAVADAVIGEISPTETANFQPHTFTYVVRPIVREENSGFDRLEIATSTRVERLRSVKVDDAEVGEEFPRDIQDDRIVVGFEKLVGSEDTEKRIEVVFDVPVLRFGQKFTGFVFSSDDPDIRQQVEEGNATLRFSTNSLSVKTPRGGELVGELRAIPAAFSPNGDGVNDQVLIQYQVRALGNSVPHVLTLYDLAGRVVRRLETAPGAAGVYEREWNGRDEAGERVPPGTYVYTVKVEADLGKQLSAGAVSVVY